MTVIISDKRVRAVKVSKKRKTHCCGCYYERLLLRDFARSQSLRVMFQVGAMSMSGIVESPAVMVHSVAVREFHRDLSR